MINGVCNEAYVTKPGEAGTEQGKEKGEKKENKVKVAKKIAKVRILYVYVFDFVYVGHDICGQARGSRGGARERKGREEGE